MKNRTGDYRISVRVKWESGTWGQWDIIDGCDCFDTEEEAEVEIEKLKEFYVDEFPDYSEENTEFRVTKLVSTK